MPPEPTDQPTNEAEVHSFSAACRLRYPDEIDGFDRFEEEVASWEARFRRARTMAQFEERNFRETGLVTARRQIGHVAAATAIRLVDLASGLIVLVNTGQAHAAYAVARSVFETASVPAYAMRNVVPQLAKSRADRVNEVLKRLSMGVDPGLDFERDPGVDPIRISKLVGALCAEVDDASGEDEGSPERAGTTMRRMYSMLSDHAHPNYSAMHLSATLNMDGMTWARPADWPAETLHDVEGPSYLALWWGGRSMDSLLRAANQHRLVLIDKRAEADG